MSRPLTMSVACGLILVSGVLLLLWGLATLSRQRSFNVAVHAVFDLDSNADTSVAKLEFTFLLGAVLSIVLACIYLFLARFIYLGSTWAKILVWLVSLGAVPLAWRTYVRNGASYLHAEGTGPDLEVAIEEMKQVNELTPWRFSGWYYNMTIGFGIALLISITGAAILLALPA